MSEPLPLVTVIIPARPEQEEVPALSGVQKLDYPRERLEIIVTRGMQPSVQRNTAARAAQGEWLYFLDDDSVPEPGNLRRAAVHFGAPAVQVLGGPNICPRSAPPLEQAFAAAMGNWLAFGPSCARYRAVGSVRDTSEKELILCNLLMRRDALLAAGGFDEALYPNEENALLDTLQARGGRLLYDPEMVVERRPRRSLKAFIKMLLNYGRGRAEQFRLHPTVGSLLNFVPPLFWVYLVALPALPGWAYGPLLLYGVAVAVAVTGSPRPAGASWLKVAVAMLLTHVFYGLGFWRGLFFTALRRPGEKPVVEVTLERIQPS